MRQRLDATRTLTHKRASLNTTEADTKGLHIRFLLPSVLVGACLGLGVLVLASGSMGSPSPGRIVWVSWAGGGTVESWFTVLGDGSGYQELKGGLPVSFALSPDGSRLASVQLGRGIVIDTFSNARSRVVAQIGFGVGSGRSIDWSGDGRLLCYSGTGLRVVAVDGSANV